MTACGRCGVKLELEGEICWWCDAELCYECWDELGHCGHPEAAKASETTRLLPDAASRQHFIRTILEGRS